MVHVTFPYNRGIPENANKLSYRIEQIVPCHLGVIYDYLFTTWRELEGFFASWSEMEAAVKSWGQAEVYIEE